MHSSTRFRQWAPLLACLIIHMAHWNPAREAIWGRHRTPERGVVNLVSYNVQSFPSTLQWVMYVPNVDRVEHIASAKVMRSPRLDVVDVLQEAFAKSTVNRLANDLSLMGFDHIVKPARHPFLINGGVMIALRSMLIRESSLTFQKCCGLDCFAAKGIIFVETRIDGKSVGIIGTHLQANDPLCVSFSNTAYEAAREVRQDQLRQIRQFVDREENARLDVMIVAGDLNVNGYAEAASDQETEEWNEMVHVLQAAPMTLTKRRTTPDHSMDPDTNSYMARIGDTKHEHLDYVLSLRLRGQSSLPNATTLRVHTARHPITNADLSDHHPVYGRVTL
ncbi:sphingomyelin phosphodiesterase [Plasmodiophora brassicae]